MPKLGKGQGPWLGVKGERHPGWRGGKKRGVCVDCGRATKLGSLRCVPCNNKFRSGPNHPLWKNGRMAPCGICGQPVFRARRHAKCMRGPNHPSWRGGYRTTEGYVMVQAPGHPRADKRGYVHRAWLVLEAKLGRYLEATEDSHHINEIPDDDRPENLEVRSHGGHTRHHSPWKGTRGRSYNTVFIRRK